MTDPNTIDRALHWIASIEEPDILAAYAVAVRETQSISAEFKAAVAPAIAERKADLMRLQMQRRRR